MKFKTIIEPFRIKTVEPIRHTTPEERATDLRQADCIKERIRGVWIVEGPPVLRRFTVRCAPAHKTLIAGRRLRDTLWLGPDGRQEQGRDLLAKFSGGWVCE